ncbi:MAG: hypothetical protein WCT46_02910 [Candidatus Gracilibacteria bacterium]|jgi:nicotinamidase-related amidase
MNAAPETIWDAQAEKLDIKRLLAEGSVNVHVDTTPAFEPYDESIQGSGELPVPGAHETIDVINSVSPHFGGRIIGLFDQHIMEGNSFCASTYQTLGIKKIPYSVITLEEFRGYRRSGIAFPFDADLFERYLEFSGGSITLWPDHARAGTPGGTIDPRIKIAPSTVFKKGTTREAHPFGSIDKGFDDSGMLSHLKDNHTPSVFVDGWAEDFCSGTAMLETAGEGIPTFYIREAVAAIDAPIKGTADTTLTVMRRKLLAAGVIGIPVDKFLEQVRSHS